MADLRVVYDGPRVDEITTISAVLRWRAWTDREKEALRKVAAGDLRRFSTDRAGVLCDIERERTA